MDENNRIHPLSKKFALRCVKLYKLLYYHRAERVMSKQLLRSGTSIGANIAESEYAQSTADFISKLSIALKEAAETKYWLDILLEAEYIQLNEYQSIYNDCISLIKLLTAIINTLKQNSRRPT